MSQKNQLVFVLYFIAKCCQQSVKRGEILNSEGNGVFHSVACCYHFHPERKGSRSVNVTEHNVTSPMNASP